MRNRRNESKGKTILYMEYLRPNHKPTYDLMKTKTEDHGSYMKVAAKPGSTFEPDWDIVRARKLLKSIDVYYPEGC